ncbi:MAG: sigma-70 family RNA polymerase sigma factor [Myxococcales bacterium]|nr:sigma-70 family RNA polymerase sigma factor [Myxococcales bacterium]
MGEFPVTQFSAIIAVKSGDPAERQRSLERLLWAYYKPVYKHLRVKWRKDPTDAEDVAHDFFARAVEKGIFGLYDPSKARFRTFVRSCLDNFVMNAEEARQRLKRGGGLEMVAADGIEAERELGLATGMDPEAIFDREWARNLFARSVAILEERLTALDKRKYFEAFKLYDLHDGAERPSYAAVAAALGVEVTSVTNYLHAARKELRAIVLEHLREITASEEEFRDEARAVLGIEV